MTDCINLKAIYGQKYRIGHDPAAFTWVEKTDPWMMTIPCRFGTIYPQGGEMLAIEIDNHTITANKVAAIPGVAPHQNGDFERAYLFHMDLFGEVAKIVRPWRKRQLSEQQKHEATQRLQKYRFAPKSPAMTPHTLGPNRGVKAKNRIKPQPKHFGPELGRISNPKGDGVSELKRKANGSKK
jgi:hypothetical protein